MLDGVPGFADRLPPGGLRDELVPLTRNRALLELFSVRSRGTHLEPLESRPENGPAGLW